jgi:hypothetical protein
VTIDRGHGLPHKKDRWRVRWKKGFVSVYPYTYYCYKHKHHHHHHIFLPPAWVSVGRLSSIIILKFRFRGKPGWLFPTSGAIRRFLHLWRIC